MTVASFGEPFDAERRGVSKVPLLVLLLAAPGPVELRGIWAWATAARTEAEADRMVATLKECNLNALFLLVFYWGGRAAWRSEIAPMMEGVEREFDPLGYIVKRAHEEGIEVHAWFVNGWWGSKEPGWVFSKHPDWTIVGPDGTPYRFWFDFGKPEVREFQKQLMLEVLRKYPVDGLHFDYIRYPGPTWCYCDRCRRGFAKAYGIDPLDIARGLPAFVSMVSSNPAVGPTTARVLAEFDDGTPAVLLNEIGEGEVLLLNWHAEGCPELAVRELARRALRYLGAKGKVLLLQTPRNIEKYPGCVARGKGWLRALGYEVEEVRPEALSSLPEGSVIAAVALYLLDEREAEAVEDFVKGGGKVLWVDGPTPSLGLEPLRRVLGVSGAGSYFAKPCALIPTAEHPIISKSAMPLEEKRRLLRAWEDFRMATVTALVREVYKEAKRIRPEAKVSAAVFCTPEAARRVLQDWPRWLREGIVDFVAPMAYVKTEKLREAIEEWKGLDPRMERIIPGLAIFNVETHKGPRKPGEVLGQIRLCREAGARGVVLFSYHQLDDALKRALKGLFSPAATE